MDNLTQPHSDALNHCNAFITIYLNVICINWRNQFSFYFNFRFLFLSVCPRASEMMLGMFEPHLYV